MIALIICLALIIIGIVFGVFTKSSFLKLTEDEKSILSAELLIDEGTATGIDESYIGLDFKTAKRELEKYSYVFRVKCIDSQLCYCCTKHTVTVIDTIKGNINENGNDIVIYQLGSFDKYNDALSFNSYDYTMPLKAGKEYIVFAEKRDYYEDYQITLKSNEYSLGMKESAPTAYILNDTQKGYSDISRDKTYSDIKHLYYLCFSQKALDNINNVAKQVISYYSKL